MVRRLRLVSGLIFFAYAVTHFINHSLGIVSIASMEAMLRVVYPFWSYPPVTAVLYGALIVHAGALRAVATPLAQDPA